MSNPVVDLSISNNSTGAASRLPHDLSTPKIPGLTITPSIVPVPAPTEASTSANNSDSRYGSRRVLRPRTEAKCYAEDIAAFNGKGTYVATDSPDEDEEMIPLYQVKELSAAEIWERERELRKLREELRNEETKLVLLKKIKHSQQLLKENINKNVSGLPQNILQNLPNTSLNPVSIIPQGLPKNSSLSVTPTNLSDYKNNTTITRQTSLDPSTSVFPLPRQSLPGGATLTTGVSSRNPILHGRNTNNISITPSVTITPTSAPSLNMKNKNLPSSNSVSITPAASITISQNNSLSSNLSDQSSRNDTQTAAQKQAAAKLALRKQLEKTLLQIPPPKPPPPEMNFIPNPNNGEFVYLIGLEHVVDYLTCKEKKTPQQQMPFRCAQCKIDFTPVWKLEKEKRGGSSESAPKKDTRIICEQCVTTNVKKALKAEHTNRLKTAFVKALQQEQEIEQRIATQAASASQSTEYSAPQAQISSHQSASAPISLSQSPVPLTVTKTPSSTPRPTPTPPNQSTPPPQSQSSSRSSRQQQQQQQHNDNMASLSFAAQLGALSNLANLGNLGGLGNLGNLGNLANLGNLGNLANLGNLGNLGNLANLSSSAQQTAAAMQAFQQQLFRGLQQGLSSNNPANLATHMQFNPLLYSYQLALAQAQAQAAQVTKGSGKTPSMAEIQRAMELQRQYLLEMMPQGSVPNSRQSNWKNN